MENVLKTIPTKPARKRRCGKQVWSLYCSKKRHGETTDRTDDSDGGETRPKTIREICEIRGHKISRPDALLSALQAKLKCGVCKEAKMAQGNVMHFRTIDYQGKMT